MLAHFDGRGSTADDQRPITSSDDKLGKAQPQDDNGGVDAVDVREQEHHVNRGREGSKEGYRYADPLVSCHLP